MLVLSRHADENIYFPNVGITVRILRVKGKMAKIGIEAPPEIAILRDESKAQEVANQSNLLESHHENQECLHRIRNQLNIVNLGVCLYRQQSEAGLVDEANLTFLKVLDDLERMDHAVKKQKAEPVKRPTDAPNRILIVEDDPRQRELLAGFLSLRGCAVSTANDGEEALQWLSHNEWPDFMVLDIRMPRCNGAETVRRLRQQSARSEIKIFAVSGTSPDEYGIDYGPDGIDCWFPKPLNPEALVDKIDQARYAKSANITTV